VHFGALNNRDGSGGIGPACNARRIQRWSSGRHIRVLPYPVCTGGSQFLEAVNNCMMGNSKPSVHGYRVVAGRAPNCKLQYEHFLLVVDSIAVFPSSDKVPISSGTGQAICIDIDEASFEVVAAGLVS
jgi:hypothetical protein